VPDFPSIDPRRLRAAADRASTALLAERSVEGAGPWTGQLSSSALSTATAVTALTLVDRSPRRCQTPGTPDRSNRNARIEAGLAWLAAQANADGGWGDTTRSLSNLSTTMLCWAAFGAVPGAEHRFSPAVQRSEEWLANRLGLAREALRRSPAALARAIIARYGKDRTFSVPILTMCALAGRLGTGRAAWSDVIPLPFELAACPHSWFAALRLPVVSYALPALIAIGQARYHHAPPANPWTRWVRGWTRRRTLKVLATIQPGNGGFLEAAPLTSFVTMSLASMGQSDHPVTRRGAEFLVRSQRSDGSWPIDTNLATWLTTLSIQALGAQVMRLDPQAARLRDWLLAQQYRVEHPYTHAAPGGWAWTDLPGGVPDADDTAGALLALKRLGPLNGPTREAAAAGLTWLLNLQNSDGGIPTFCRGWGTLPFDQSSEDITAHALGAWFAWFDETEPALRARLTRAGVRAIRFLERSQRSDGSWVPLWFGNQFAPEEENQTYGTARVVQALAQPRVQTRLFPGPFRTLTRGVRWLLEAQKSDGSWGGFAGGPSSVEETALAVEALACASAGVRSCADPTLPAAVSAAARGALWLIDRVEAGTWTEPSPIGFYFAKLWYYERLYPMIFTAGALRRMAKNMGLYPEA
jgi:squalene-hopene/tetraprenyl-beta-curcumene cyclase